MATKITSIPLASEERKRLRQLKFADPKLVNRVQRFGAQQQSTIKKLIEPSEDGKLLKRVERFGEIVSNKAKTLNERERIERRKQRFGGAISTAKVSAVGGSSASSENIRKRQDRFGVVEKPVSNQTLSNQILQKSENSNHDDEYGSDSMHQHHHHNQMQIDDLSSSSRTSSYQNLSALYSCLGSSKGVLS